MPRPSSVTVQLLSGCRTTLTAVAVAGERLVDRVVDHLVDEVVQPAGAGRADVHPGPLADRLEALEDGDVLGAVGVALLARLRPACSCRGRFALLLSQSVPSGCHRKPRRAGAAHWGHDRVGATTQVAHKGYQFEAPESRCSAHKSPANKRQMDTERLGVALRLSDRLDCARRRRPTDGWLANQGLDPRAPRAARPTAGRSPRRSQHASSRSCIRSSSCAQTASVAADRRRRRRARRPARRPRRSARRRPRRQAAGRPPAGSAARPARGPIADRRPQAGRGRAVPHQAAASWRSAAGPRHLDHRCRAAGAGSAASPVGGDQRLAAAVEPRATRRSRRSGSSSLITSSSSSSGARGAPFEQRLRARRRAGPAGPAAAGPGSRSGAASGRRGDA